MSHTAMDKHAEIWIEQLEANENPLACSSKKNMEEAYALAYVLYQNKRYVESELFFRTLVAIHPSEIKFWKGFGSCLQMQQDYQQALNCYLSCVQLMEEENIDPYVFVQIADCYFALKQTHYALKVLECAYVIAKKTNLQPIIQHVLFLRETHNQVKNVN